MCHTTSMQKNIILKLHLLTADKQLRQHLPRIKKLAQPVLKMVRQLLPFRESVDIVIYRYHAPNSDFATSGYTPTANTVWLYTDPGQPNYTQFLNEQLPKVLAHELHHACRFQGPGYGKTLGEVLITEGLAAHFEQEITGDVPSGFYVQFAPKTLALLWKKAQTELQNESYNHTDWFFGNPAKKIPAHAGYGLGYWLTSKAVDTKKPSRLVMTRAGQILK